MGDPDRFKTHGPVRVSGSGTYLAHADGTPFFYLADTAWNGGLLSTDEEWEEYLADRASKGFTAIQLITHAPWTAALADQEGQVAFNAKGHLNEPFFERMDRKLAAINAHGMLAVPVLAWAANFGASARLNIGHTLSTTALTCAVDDQMRAFSRRHVMWVLAGDGRYGWWKSRKWKKVGRSWIFGGASRPVGSGPPWKAGERRPEGLGLGRAPVAMHPMGGHWPYRWFEGEAWLDVLGYQSSHSEDPKVLRWLQEGPPAKAWKKAKKARPVINMEPVYERITAGNGVPFSREAVRRAVWWSLLNAPTAGVTYGAHGVWGWHDREMESLNHVGLGTGPSWREAMKFPAAGDMARVAEFMRGIEWWRLRPDGELVEQAFKGDPRRFVGAARSEEGDLAVVYVPEGHVGEGGIMVRHAWLATGSIAYWFDPRTGVTAPAERAGDRYEPPGGGDWVWVWRKR